MRRVFSWAVSLGLVVMALVAFSPQGSAASDGTVTSVAVSTDSNAITPTDSLSVERAVSDSIGADVETSRVSTRAAGAMVTVTGSRSALTSVLRSRPVRYASIPSLTSRLIDERQRYRHASLARAALTEPANTST